MATNALNYLEIYLVMERLNGMLLLCLINWFSFLIIPDYFKHWNLEFNQKKTFINFIYYVDNK